MRSLSRGLVVGALALPLAFAGTGLATAADSSGHEGHHKKPVSHNHDWDFKWNWKWTHVSDDDIKFENSGIIG